MGDIISSSVSRSSSDKKGDERTTTASRRSNVSQSDESFDYPPSIRIIQEELEELFSENVAAKIWKVAETVLEQQV